MPLPIETLVNSVRARQQPVVVQQPVSEAPVQQRPQGQQSNPALDAGDAAGEFIRALFNNLGNNAGATPAPDAVQPQQGAAGAPYMLPDLSVLQPAPQPAMAPPAASGGLFKG